MSRATVIPEPDAWRLGRWRVEFDGEHYVTALEEADADRIAADLNAHGDLPRYEGVGWLRYSEAQIHGAVAAGHAYRATNDPEVIGLAVATAVLAAAEVGDTHQAGRSFAWPGVSGLRGWRKMRAYEVAMAALREAEQCAS